MSDFIWVASFPKSGSTWLRFILAHLLFDPGDEKRLVRQMVPSIHDWRGPLRYDWQGAYPVKTHLAGDNLPARMHSRSAIHVYRNPLDIVDSTISYMRLQTEAEREDIINQFCLNGTIEPWGQTLGYGSWEHNYNSWRDAAIEFPVLSLRYEDMLDQPCHSVRRIADFLGVEADDEKIDYVVSETTFSKMKKEEDREISGDKEGVFSDEHKFNKKTFQFMRSGKSGGYKESMTQSEIERLLTRFSPVMEAEGYL